MLLRKPFLSGFLLQAEASTFGGTSISVSLRAFFVAKHLLPILEVHARFTGGAQKPAKARRISAKITRVFSLSSVVIESVESCLVHY